MHEFQWVAAHATCTVSDVTRQTLSTLKPYPSTKPREDQDAQADSGVTLVSHRLARPFNCEWTFNLRCTLIWG